MRDAVFARTKQRQASEKLINELGWRDYWQRLWAELGDGIWSDQESLKTGHHTGAYAESLPADLADGQTGLACMDGFIQELHQTGWLHNHARMGWGGVVHWRRSAGRPAPSGSCATCSMGTRPATTSAGSGWPAASAAPFFNRSNLSATAMAGTADCALSGGLPV